MEAVKNIKDDSFVVLRPFMLKDLGLRGNELIAYALIYGFSNKEDKWFEGDLKYIAKWTNSDVPYVSRILKKLKAKGLLRFKKIKDLRRVHYKALVKSQNIEKICCKNYNNEVVKNTTGSCENYNNDVVKNTMGSCENYNNDVVKKTNYNIYNNINNNIRDNIGGDNIKNPPPPPYISNLRELKEIIINSTQRTEHEVNLVFKTSNYPENIIHELLSKIKSNPYLMGEKINKPNLGTFVTPGKIKGILAGLYDEYEDVPEQPKELLYGNAKDYDIKPANELVEKLLGIKTLE